MAPLPAESEERAAADVDGVAIDLDAVDGSESFA